MMLVSVLDCENNLWMSCTSVMLRIDVLYTTECYMKELQGEISLQQSQPMRNCLAKNYNAEYLNWAVVT